MLPSGHPTAWSGERKNRIVPWLKHSIWTSLHSSLSCSLGRHLWSAVGLEKTPHVSIVVLLYLKHTKPLVLDRVLGERTIMSTFKAHSCSIDVPLVVYFLMQSNKSRQKKVFSSKGSHVFPKSYVSKTLQFLWSSKELWNKWHHASSIPIYMNIVFGSPKGLDTFLTILQTTLIKGVALL